MRGHPIFRQRRPGSEAGRLYCQLVTSRPKHLKSEISAACRTSVSRLAVSTWSVECCRTNQTKTNMQHKPLDVLGGHKSVLRPHTGRRVGDSGVESPRAAATGACRNRKQREL